MSISVDQFKFGFEFETLIEATTNTSNTLAEKLYKGKDDLIKSANKATGRQFLCSDDPEKKRKVRSSVIQRMIRHTLASKYNDGFKEIPNQPNYIVYTPDYSEEPCIPGLYPLFEKEIEWITQDMLKNPRSRWIIEHDSSVQVAQTNKTKTNIYDNLENALIEKQNDPETLPDKSSLFVNQEDIPNSKSTIENIEFVSPVFGMNPNSFRDILVQVESIFKENGANSLRFVNNSTTSNHIHYSCPKSTTQDTSIFKDPLQLYNVCKAWLLFEPLFFRLVPRWRRNNVYCQSMATLMFNDANVDTRKKKLYSFLQEKNIIGFERITDGIQDEDKKIWSVIAQFQGDPSEKSTRYAALNLMNLKPDGIGTIEVRLKHGSSDMNEMCGYILLFTAFFTAALNDDGKTNASNLEGFDHLWMLRTYDQTFKRKQECLNALYKFLGKANLNAVVFEDLMKFCTRQLYLANFKSDTKQMEVDEILDYPVQDTHGGAHIEEKFPVFSYGSNSSKQLRERTGAISQAYPAYLDNWTRIFAGYSNFRKGGVASVHPHQGSRVYGCVYELTQEQIDILDRYEPGYTRKRKFVKVRLSNGESKRVKAFVYVRDDNAYTSPPSESYMQAIRTMLDEANRGTKSAIDIRGFAKEGKKQVLKKFGYYKPGKLIIFKKPKVVE